LDVQEEAVRRTVAWARRCKAEFQRILDQKKVEHAQRTLLFGVIEGGGYPDLRKRCADELLEIGFDGFGYGGWPLDEQGNLLRDIIAYTREIVPRELPMHALGVGHPASIAECARIGYDLFDSSLPTRDARRGRLYVLATGLGFQSGAVKDWFSQVYVSDNKHIKSTGPISPYCDCLCCTEYSLGYLHHLFKIEDALSLRLATIHNLRTMVLLMEQLRGSRSGNGG